MNLSISNSRRLVVIYFAVGAAMLATFVGASEWLVRTKAIPEDSFQKHVALFEETTSPYVVFGDSHAARDFAAEPPVVNLAYPSENIEKMAWKANHYLARNPAPRKVLIQADPHLFADYRTGAGMQDYKRAFSSEKKPVLESLSARYRPQLIQLWRSFVETGGTLKSEIETTPQGALLSPGNLADWPAHHIEDFTKERVTLHRPADGFQSSQAAQLYRQMIDSFAAHGAEVCLVAFPMSQAYRDEVTAMPASDRAMYDEAIDFFKELAASPKIQFIDDRARYSNPALFRDPDHLNKRGALLYGPELQAACFGDVEEEPGDQIAAR